MRQQLLFIHGGGGGAYEADGRLAASLRDELGAGYDVRYPAMLDADSPLYDTWKDQIASELAEMSGPAVLVGHSLGASLLLKYLADAQPQPPVAGLFLIACPFWGAEDWQVDEFALPEDFAARLPKELPIFFYHSRDDEVVPFDHLALYAARLPRAALRAVDGRDHQFDNDLSDVARDIQAVVAARDA